MGHTNRIITEASSVIYRVVVTSVPNDKEWVEDKYRVGETRLFETSVGAKSFHRFLKRHDCTSRVEIGEIEWSTLI